VKIDAGLDLHTAGRDAEVDRQHGAEFQRGLDLVHPVGRDADAKEAPAA
jgi:hypothetical protein